ncbi:hypothetical protein [Anaeromyxobacter paludicola]|uniref:Uncharacterized protein n=1 Tax=Anaeromyxobacter paludicola TaxID=2918171 RepID=A0ABM7X508_9BACT|nr:hypothetical protein [Anaeromyxobacter paludicola]BDG06890.1 hypothetical protein AMPC_00030 [Anaeromyxobacter paludicola]
MSALPAALIAILAAPLHGRLPAPDAGAGGYSGAFHGGAVSALWLTVAGLTALGILASLLRRGWH